MKCKLKMLPCKNLKWVTYLLEVLKMGIPPYFSECQFSNFEFHKKVLSKMPGCHYILDS